jgi:hypothetical protein
MKKTWYFFMVIFLALGLSACASNTESSRSEPPAEEAPQTFEEVYDIYRSDLILDGAAPYKVVKGDTLSTITRKHYGANNGFFFPLIMLASSNVVSDPDRIEPDMTLTIPDLQRNLDNAKAREKIKAFLIDIAGIYERKEKPVIQQRLMELAVSL